MAFDLTIQSFEFEIWIRNSMNKPQRIGRLLVIFRSRSGRSTRGDAQRLRLSWSQNGAVWLVRELTRPSPSSPFWALYGLKIVELTHPHTDLSGKLNPTQARKEASTRANYKLTPFKYGLCAIYSLRFENVRFDKLNLKGGIWPLPSIFGSNDLTAERE